MSLNQVPRIHARQVSNNTQMVLENTIILQANDMKVIIGILSSVHQCKKRTEYRTSFENSDFNLTPTRLRQIVQFNSFNSYKVPAAVFLRAL